MFVFASAGFDVTTDAEMPLPPSHCHSWPLPVQQEPPLATFASSESTVVLVENHLSVLQPLFHLCSMSPAAVSAAVWTLDFDTIDGDDDGHVAVGLVGWGWSMRLTVHHDEQQPHRLLLRVSFFRHDQTTQAPPWHLTDRHRHRD